MSTDVGVQVSSSAPRRRGLRIVRDGVFFFKETPSLILSVAPPFKIESASLGFDFDTEAGWSRPQQPEHDPFAQNELCPADERRQPGAAYMLVLQQRFKFCAFFVRRQRIFFLLRRTFLPFFIDKDFLPYYTKSTISYIEVIA